ncbi:phosphoribosylamine--glycine ligase [Alicyclobacillus sp. SO9]|uniref:phosphoribosylamine--glycine ligase n=1 Tax=Alicyclobacillus sp. SO9 TaxID=2665646 RepID=UPI0018E7596E|nr:phosphoribosylamine--glycine ligase [Alicyclobacillus sp. SO9]QQE78564.1 phosphoribosylamine--glycine ligase [Alicyclobacillus sp. SO9]
MTSTSKADLPQNPKVLVVGGGAREHALAWKLAQSRHKPVLFAAPGNPGIRDVAECVDIQANDISGLIGFAKSQAVHLVVVGPEAPLAQGLADELLAAGIPVFGPSQNGAQLETSKAFAKQVMAEAGVPTAAYKVFERAEDAKDYVRAQGAPIVIKADGLAAGKGVVVAQTEAEAEGAIDNIMTHHQFGEAGARVVVEAALTGSEASLMYFVDKNTFVPMLPAQDHKRLGEGDTGPNTGGMGAFAPIPGVDTTGLQQQVSETIVQPVMNWLQEHEIPFRGVLYVGLMLTESGPQVIEFNVRFGDPEAEVVLPLLQSDVLDILWAAAHDSLSDTVLEWHDESAVCVVMATPGYPKSAKTGQEIHFSKELPQHTVCFHAGTKLDGTTLMTAGGRVLTVCARGENLDTARRIAYDAVDCISFEGMQMRSDIGEK